MHTEPVVFVVDDDAEVRQAVSLLARSVHLNVETFASASEFLERFDRNRPACLVLDVRMPGMDGLELQKELARQNIEIPIIVITAHADVPTAVESLRAGAQDFVEKPFSRKSLLSRIETGIEQSQRTWRIKRQRQSVQQRLETLTPRERAVLDALVAGDRTKKIAIQLELSPKTVDNYRSTILRKMQAENLAQLIWLMVQYGPKDQNTGN